MTNAELADEIEQKAAIGDGHVALTNKKWQQSIAALRRQPPVQRAAHHLATVIEKP